MRIGTFILTVCITAFALNTNAQINSDEELLADIQKALLLNDYNTALNLIKSKEPSSSINFNIYKGIAYENICCYNGAIEAYCSAIKIDSTHAIAYNGLARCYSTLNNWGKAMGCYQI